ALATGMLFAMAGWVYDQTHTRDIPSLGGLVNRMPFVAGCFLVACMASVGMPGTVNFIAEVMILVGSWNKYPIQVIIAVVGIVLTLAYLFRMMRGVFYGSMEAKYSRAHDAVTIVDRLPLLLMIGCSITFGIFPGHFYDVIRSGVDPLLARIIAVAPLAAQDREGLGVRREAKVQPITSSALRLTDDASRRGPVAFPGGHPLLLGMQRVPGAPHALRGEE
ncbi:MAG: proton-conducting transporter membrane subunit, partial [Nitrospirota bacterium]